MYLQWRRDNFYIRHLFTWAGGDSTQTPCPFGFLSKGALIGELYLRETWPFAAVSALGGIPSCLETYYTSGDSYGVSNEPYGLLIVFMT